MTSQKNLQKLISENRIWFGKNGDNVPRIKKFITDVQQGIVPLTIWTHDEVGHNQSAKQDLKKIFNKPNFYYWKDFFQADSKMNEKISIVLPSDRYALLTQLKKWLQIDTLLINTQTTDTILNILKNQKNLLTFLPSSVVYNLDTKYRKDFLYIIPLDLNNDNWISDDEYLYDNIMILGQAVLNKKIDTSLILNYKMIYSIDNPLKDSLINLLNNKQNINKNIFEKFGYFAY